MMSENVIKEILQKLARSDEEIKNMAKLGGMIVVPNVGISSEELSRQLLIISQIIHKQNKIEIINELKHVYDSKVSLEDSLQELSDRATNPDDFSSDIPSLKKRIKYCKNPLERKSLERQLDVAYKKMKKRR